MSKEIPGALALASSGAIDFDKATDIAAMAMSRFGVSEKDISSIADLLAASSFSH